MLKTKKCDEEYKDCLASKYDQDTTSFGIVNHNDIRAFFKGKRYGSTVRTALRRITRSTAVKAQIDLITTKEKEIKTIFDRAPFIYPSFKANIVSIGEGDDLFTGNQKERQQAKSIIDPITTKSHNEKIIYNAGPAPAAG